MKKAKRILALLMAVLMVMGALAGCGPKDDDGVVTLTWYFLGDTTNPDNDEVYQMASDMVYEKLGFKVDFLPIDYSSYDEKMKMIIAGGEDYDICWTSNWKNDYATNVANGAFLALDDLLEETPALKDSIDEKIWNGTRIGGKIYGVPVQQIMARSTGICIPAELYNKYESTLKDVKDFADLDAYMAAFGTDTPDTANVNLNWQNLCYDLGIDDVISVGFPCSVYLEGEADDITVFNPYETEEYKEAVALMGQWKEKGYIIKGSDGAATGSLKRPIDQPFTIDTWKPGVEVGTEANLGYPVKYIVTSDPWLTSGGINATLHGINSRSKHPVEALKLLEYVNTDSEIANLIINGIEGKHYEKVGENTIKRVENTGFKNDNWVMANTFIAYLYEGQPEDTNEATKALNDSAKASRLLGFTPNLDNIQLEIANCKSVTSEYRDRVQKGDLSLLDEMNAKYKEAGLDKVIAEMQTQIDEWLKTK